MSIFVTTPTGNIGRVIVDELIAAGETDISVLVRNPDRLAPGVREKVTVHVGDIFDEAAVVKATQGADVLFWLNPPNFTVSDWRAQFEQSAHIGASAVKTNHIPHVVFLSSAGADQATGYGPVSLLQIIENALSATDAHVLHLRPGYFYENFLAQLEQIRKQGIIAQPFGPEITWPLIATHDIGVVAARKLRARDWNGTVYLGLHGPAPTPSFGEAAHQIGEGIGKPVQFVTVPKEIILGGFQQMGASQSIISGYSEMLDALGRGGEPAEPRTAETTTPTTLQEWARQVIKPLIG